MVYWRKYEISILGSVHVTLIEDDESVSARTPIGVSFGFDGILRESNIPVPLGTNSIDVVRTVSYIGNPLPIKL